MEWGKQAALCSAHPLHQGWLCLFPTARVPAFSPPSLHSRLPPCILPSIPASWDAEKSSLGTEGLDAS